uniref:Reverse transcriptase domain-containing protein n=1 Tax=Cannabis sativa TaxID=3483 RepID=A0A803PT25_CANSA
MYDGNWERNPNSIANWFIERFNNTYIDEKTAALPALRCLDECGISVQDNEHLKAFPTKKEIEMCVRSMGQERAPGPDGMSTSFYLQHWATVKRDVFDMVTHFFRNFELSQCINNTNIVLIPKKEFPSGVNDYRPIALSQTTLVKGRLIAQNTAIQKEIIHSMGKNRFDEVFIRWVNKCIELKRMGLLLDGDVQGVISPTCGLRQGDPLSPALFIIAVDVLSKLLMAKNEEGKIASFKFTRGGPTITHLMFADDIILFGKASVKEAKSFLNCLKEYCAWSGQAVNYQKSTVHFTQGFLSKKAEDIMNILGMKRMKKDSMYLGLQLFRSLRRSKDLNLLVDKVMQRVKSWKTRLLSVDRGFRQLIKYYKGFLVSKKLREGFSWLGVNEP